MEENWDCSFSLNFLLFIHKVFFISENKDIQLPVKKPGESVKILFGPSYHNCEHGDFSIMYREVYMKISYL
jgi:hypothetical protein